MTRLRIWVTPIWMGSTRTTMLMVAVPPFAAMGRGGSSCTGARRVEPTTPSLPPETDDGGGGQRTSEEGIGRGLGLRTGIGPGEGVGEQFVGLARKPGMLPDSAVICFAS